MDEILNLSTKLCAQIHDLTSFHTRVFVQTALGSESSLVSQSRCFWHPYGLIGTRWLLVYNISCCPQTVNPPENHIAAGNRVPASMLEMNAKKPLHCCDRITNLQIRIISKHAVFYRPMLDSY